MNDVMIETLMTDNLMLHDIQQILSRDPSQIG